MGQSDQQRVAAGREKLDIFHRPLDGVQSILATAVFTSRGK